MVALLLIIIAVVNIPSLRAHMLMISAFLLVFGIIGVWLISHHGTRSYDSTERDLENRLKEREEALNAAYKKLMSATEELKYTKQKMVHTETQKSLTSIVSGFAHEINNPLTGILGYVDLMEMNDDLSPYSKKRLESIKDQAVRIKEIVDQLNWLDPEQEQVKGEINLANLLEKMIKIIGKEKEGQGITFERTFPDEPILVSGNHFALWQVFEGIIENAVEAIGDKEIPAGKIRAVLKKSVEQNIAIVEFTDNGGGFISTDKAFNPFYTTKCRTQKRGIGLSIAFNLVQEHMGNLSIKNNEEGAVVTVHLPLSSHSLEKTENKTNSMILHKKMSGGY